MREHTCCISGHRDLQPSEAPLLSVRLALEIMEALNAGCTRFVTGMATGTDLIFAENVLVVKKYFPQVELVAAISHRGRLKDKNEEFQRLIGRCDQVIVLSERYRPGACAARTRWLLDNSCRLIAVWDDREHGGIFRTINRALKMNITVRDIEPFLYLPPRRELPEELKEN